MALRCCAYFLLSIAYISSCGGAHRTTVEFYIVDGYRFSQAERDSIQEIADATAFEVKRLLPGLPDQLTLKVQAGKDVLPETGDRAEWAPSGVVYWTVDPRRSGGVAATVSSQLRPTLFFAWHHVVRLHTHRFETLMDVVIADGMATAFERDFAHTRVPWGEYPANVSTWVKDLMSLPPNPTRDQWMSHYPDGGRWIGFKTGTYLVDRAMKASGKSAAELVTMPTQDVLRMALKE